MKNIVMQCVGRNYVLLPVEKIWLLESNFVIVAGMVHLSAEFLDTSGEEEFIF